MTPDPAKVNEAVRGLVGAITAVQSNDDALMQAAASNFLDSRVQIEQWDAHIAAIMMLSNQLIHDLAHATGTPVDAVLSFLGEWAANLSDQPRPITPPRTPRRSSASPPDGSSRR